MWIAVLALWTGIDSGPMYQHWRDLYMQPFWNLDHAGPPDSVDVPMDLSGATRLFVTPWTNNNDRYAVHSYHSDYWWDEEFIALIADEVDERVAMVPEIYPSFQYLPLGRSSQWARNADKNALTWRDARPYVDDWMFTKNESRYQEMTDRMRSFREKTRKYWQYSDGSERSTWMSPNTLYPGATDLRVPSVARQYFPNATQYHQLQLLKAELDPQDVFSNKVTIPLPDAVQVEV